MLFVDEFFEELESVVSDTLSRSTIYEEMRSVRYDQNSNDPSLQQLVEITFNAASDVCGQRKCARLRRVCGYSRALRN